MAKRLYIRQGDLLDRVGYAVVGGEARGLRFTRSGLIDFIDDSPIYVEEAINDLIDGGYLTEDKYGIHSTKKAYYRWV